MPMVRQRDNAQQVRLIREAERKYKEEMNKVTTRHKHDSYRSLEKSDGVNRGISVSSNMAMNEHYQESNKITQSMLKFMSIQLSNIRNECVSFMSAITTLSGPGVASSGILDPNNMGTKFISNVAQALNAPHQNNYLFSGTAANIPPVREKDLIDTANINTDGTVNTSYYKGNKETRSFRISPHQSIEITVLGNAQPFADVFAAAHLIKKFATSHDHNDLEKASSLLASAHEGITKLKSGIDNMSGQLSALSDQLIREGSILAGEYNRIYAADQAKAISDTKEAMTDHEGKIAMLVSQYLHERERQEKLSQLA